MKLRFFSLLLAVIYPFLIFPQGAASETITILYTASLNGNLDGCECTSAPKAGLVTSAVFLREEIEKGALFFNLGDSLDVYPDSDLHSAILDSYLGLDITASAAGDQDFIEGIEWFKEREFPFLLHNIGMDGTGPEEDYLSLEVGGITIGVAGITESSTFFFAPEALKERLEFGDPEETAEKLLNRMEDDGTAVKILLYHGPSEDADRIFESDPRWDIVLAGHEQRLSARYGDGEKRFFGSPGENGNRVGILTIRADDGVISEVKNRFLYFDYILDPKDPILVRTIDRYKRAMIERLKR